MTSSKNDRINSKYLKIDLMRVIIMATLMALYSAILCIDCYRKGVPSTARLALFDAVATSLTLPALLAVKRSRDPERPLMKVLLHLSIIFLCIVYWCTFAVFIYKGSMSGTSLFLIFMAAPVGFYFFNMFYGMVFCLVLFFGMIIYMWTPLHLQGYAFPDMYFIRLPLMFLVETIVCALAQYETVKAQSKQEQALLEAERANRAKTDFLSSMSHEIRTPINAVLGMNEMILRETFDAKEDLPEDREKIKEILSEVGKYSLNIESAGNNLLAIINDILDFSKIEAGKLEIVKADYRLSSVLNDVSNMIYFKAEDKGLDFTVDVDESLPDGLKGDEVRLRQIMTNLLTNAVKYTKEGSVRLKVSSDEVANGQEDGMIRLIVSVSDTGIGIKEEDIDKMFDKFQRVNLVQTSTVEGTGLGLAITRNLLDMMGGSISVKSTYGKGSTFTATIPQQVTDKEPVGNFHDKFEKSMQSMHTYRESFRAPDARILIVDDTRMNLMVVEGLLKNTGIVVDTATGGEQSVKMAADVKYDVILMDQRMPEMDGTEAMHRIVGNNDSINHDTPFICLTADAVSGAKEKYLSEGFADYLTKPIDSSALEKMLMKHLPVEKVYVCKVKTSEGSGISAANKDGVPDEFEALKEAGVDVSKGLRFTGGDREFYRSLLAEYIRSYPEKSKKIKSYYDAGDWKNYGILVHSVKSSSRMIGAQELAESAAGLEAATKKADADIIHAKDPAVMDGYAALVKALEAFIPETADDVAGNDEDIMEFLPQ